MERRCWVNFQCRGVLQVWMTVGQGPIALAVGADGVVWTCFLSSIFSFFFLPLFGRRPVLSQRAFKPKTTNQPTNEKQEDQFETSCHCAMKIEHEAEKRSRMEHLRI